MTQAIPFGVYIAPTNIFSDDIRKRVDNDFCYIQLLKRLSYTSYAVHVASSSQELRSIDASYTGVGTSADGIFVSTISRQDLHLWCNLVSAPQASAPIYAAPDCVLMDKCSQDSENLQLFASSAWLCYFQVLNEYTNGSVAIRVAALPHRVDGQHGRSYTTTLTRSQFALALQLERQDLNLSTDDLLKKVERKASYIRGRSVEHIHPKVILEDDEAQDTTTPAYPPEVLKMLRPVEPPCAARAQQRMEEDLLPEAHPTHTRALPPVFVPESVAQEAVERFRESTGKVPTSRKDRQKVWLQAVLSTLRLHKEETRERRIAKAILRQDQATRRVLVNWLSDSVQLVKATRVKITPQACGYVVRVEQPAA